MKSAKAHLMLNGVLLIILLLLLVGTTVAYFSDSRQVSNTMTAGNVEISLSEASVKSDENGNLIKDETKSRVYGGKEPTINDYGRIFPSQTIYKDPTVENIGDDKAWIAIKLTVDDGDGDIHNVLGYPGYDGIDIHYLLSGKLFSEITNFGEWIGLDYVSYNENYAMLQVPKRSESKYEFYCFIEKPLASDKSVTLFDTMTVPAYWNYAQLQELRDLKITVQAFAVQTVNLENCFSAMLAAFPEHFNF